jgi:hypothetical protein
MRPGKRSIIGATAGMLATLAVLLFLFWHEEPVDPQLRQQLAQAREQRLADLEVYIKHGEFPHNHDFRGERVPYLVDRHGRLCAVAYLFSASQVEDFKYFIFIMVNNVADRPPNPSIIGSFARALSQDDGPATDVQSRLGKFYLEVPCEDELQLRRILEQSPEAKSPDVAQKIEERLCELAAQRADTIRMCVKHRAWFQSLPNLVGIDNHVRVKHLKPGPLWDWILTSGLTREECAMIQPSYSYLYVACDHCVPGSEARTEQLEGSDYYRMLRSEQERVRSHLTGVLRKLRETSDRSLDLATRRLQQAGGLPSTVAGVTPGP